ncbi:MAG: hypothetical protein ABSE16_04525 [Verrucomicrobiota bacterium]|jgi:hypothetical protein
MSASADLLFDRGLPTANINTGNANQANVAWADSESSPSGPFYLPGDDFTLSGSGAYQVTDIRVWTTDPTAGLSLLGGVAGTTIGTISSSYTATPVTYANGQGYQTQSGSFLQIYQLDFSVNLALNGGQTFQFFLNGPPSLYGDGTYVNAYLLASNAALSGSPQEGANGQFLWLAPDGTVLTWYSGDGGGTSGWYAGWDKNSDGDVQVFGTPVPEASTMIAGALLLLPFGASTLRILRKTRTA